ncbi:MAG: class I SAM-dependent methyltransferase [Rhodocyclales bacterium]|nr:class I SAM-dependent methyltransferase [Rhodocyclales bacterium]
MSLGDRLRYMALNFVRNLDFRKSAVSPTRFCMPRQARTSGLVSPSRSLTEAFLCRQLPALLPVGEIRVLDIGCGAGGLVRLLAELGYRGSYVGIDIQDGFDRSEQPGFEKSFLAVDAHRYQPENKFDLVISVSALEHIPDDARLIRRLGEFLLPGGLQLHFVPSEWALPVYLWHGYRQYTVASLADRFETSRTVVFSLGGAASFFLHLFFITVWEILLRLSLRKRWSGLYTRLLDACLAIDRYLPVLGTFYAVVWRVEPSGSDLQA